MESTLTQARRNRLRGFLGAGILASLLAVAGGVFFQSRQLGAEPPAGKPVAKLSSEELTSLIRHDLDLTSENEKVNAALIFNTSTQTDSHQLREELEHMGFSVQPENNPYEELFGIRIDVHILTKQGLNGIVPQLLPPLRKNHAYYWSSGRSLP